MTTPPATPSSSQIPDSFEHLIAGASACFLQSDADAIDSEIERAFAAYLREKIEVRHRHEDIIGNSAAVNSSGLAIRERSRSTSA